MSDGRSAAAAQRVGAGAARVARAWRMLPPERRLAAIAAILLFLSLFLPWYQRQFFVVVSGTPKPASDSQTGWAAFSFVEAAVLLVAAGVLVLLFQRAEGRAFHVPGGDGGVIMAAGLWTCVLIVWRMFDKQGGLEPRRRHHQLRHRVGHLRRACDRRPARLLGFADPCCARARAAVAG